MDDVSFTYDAKENGVKFAVTAWKDSEYPGLNIYINNRLAAVVEICMNSEEDGTPEVNVRAYKDFTDDAPETVKWAYGNLPFDNDNWKNLQTKPFKTPFEQYSDRNGETFTVLRRLDPGEIDEGETGAMFRIRFDSNVQVIDTYPEEIFEGFEFNQQPVKNPRAAIAAVIAKENA